LKAKLKQKDKLREENERLQQEVDELKSKYQESQRRQIAQSKQIETL
jgi:hypothetical protein